MTENPNPVPEWVDGKKINEVLFCREFLEEHPMVSVGGAFFTVEGLVSDENLLKKQIYDKIKYHITTGLWKKVSNEICKVLSNSVFKLHGIKMVGIVNQVFGFVGYFTISTQIPRNRENGRCHS